MPVITTLLDMPPLPVLVAARLTLPRDTPAGPPAGRDSRPAPRPEGSAAALPLTAEPRQLTT